MAVFVCGTISTSAAPSVVPAYASRVALVATRTEVGKITQMTWGPGGRLYASRHFDGAVSFAYDAASGAIGAPIVAQADTNGIGIAYHAARGELYLGSFNALWRLKDDDNDHRWGEAGELRVALVSDIPSAFHSLDQFQLQGNSLYVGIGIRGIDGRTDAASPFPPGESALGGTICWIEDLSLVPDAPDAARSLGASSSPTVVQTDATPYTTTDPAKLRVHSAGTRNPFGLAFDAAGRLHFTNNFNRAQTNGDGSAAPFGWTDEMGPDFTLQVHDQFFRAVAGGDYGYPNDNWRGVRDPAVIAAILDPLQPGYQRVRSLTPDNLFASDANFHQLHDPAHPVGLGPSSSADGFAFWSASALPPGLQGAAFIARFVGSVSENPAGDTLVYGDLVAVDSSTGEATRIASGFANPLAVIVDDVGRLLVADYGAEAIHTFAAIAGDDDTIPVFWREKHFGHPFGQAGDLSRGTDDADGDGATNEEEYLAATLPGDATSVYRITSIVVGPVDVVVTFPTVAGRSYLLQRCDDLSIAAWVDVGTVAAGDGTELAATDVGAASLSQRFYRVQISLP